MRQSQPQYLSTEANTFLNENAICTDKCEKCHRHSGFEFTVIGKYGMFDELSLKRYKLKDGRTASEFEQAEIWSSGPMIWLGLRTSDGIEFKWDEEDIRE